jgi:two-component system phosphate regulon sensor histidine kinase PhoR
MKVRLSFQGLILLGCLGVVLGTLIFVAAILQQSMREQMVEDLTRTLQKEIKLVIEAMENNWPANAPPAD